jgi:hypothetical protein
MMYLGQRLVIRGAIFGSILLGAFLFLTSTHASYAQSIPTQMGAAVKPAILVEKPSTTKANPTPPRACELSDQFPTAIRQWCELITRYSTKHNLPVDLIAALIWQESGGNPQAYSSSGAVGLMQIMPSDGLAASFQCQNGPCFTGRPSTDELKDPEFNLAYGTRMLARLLENKGSLREALKSYGPMNVGFYYADKVLGIFEQYRK